MEAPAKDVLHDLVEMVKGIQHPLRGLFLRNYLSEMTKDKLPDVGNKYEGSGGSVTDSVEFVLENFKEMNKLWVRMQPPKGARRDKDQRERERMDLRLLVGKNLAQLGQLDGVTESVYVDVVLPAIIDQIVSCGDRIAQQYLMECVVQVFPDEYHLRTLDQLLSTCSKLVVDVSIKPIVTSLLVRLTNYAAQQPLPDVFGTLFDGMQALVRERDQMALEDALELLVALMALSLKCYPGESDNIDRLLQFANTVLDRATDGGAQKCTNRKQVRQISRLIMLPLETYGDIIRVLGLPNYAPVLSYLNYYTRKMIALDVAKNAIDSEAAIEEPADVERLLRFIAPLVRDEPDQPADDQIDPEDFEHEQNIVASLVHLFASASSDKLFVIYLTARKLFAAGDPKRTRIRHTIVPLVFRTLALAPRMKHDTLDSKLVAAKRQAAAAALQKNSADDDNDNVAVDDGDDMFDDDAATTESAVEAAGLVDQDELTKRPAKSSNVVAVESEAAKLWAKKGRKLFRFVHDTVAALVSSMPDLALKLYLQAAQAASRCGFETIAYEFLTQAFVLYEGEIFESKDQFNTMNLIIGTLQTLRCFGADNYDTLITKAALLSSKLLAKADQCQSVLRCSHLFWTGTSALAAAGTTAAADGESLSPSSAGAGAASSSSTASQFQDGKRVLECLQRCLKIADQISDPANNVRLFIDILNEYLYYFSNGNSSITVKYLNSLIALINTNISGLSPPSPNLDAYYRSTLDFILSKQKKYEAWRPIVASS
jgi:vacuolar protein sorting-associated protein 35